MDIAELQRRKDRLTLPLVSFFAVLALLVVGIGAETDQFVTIVAGIFLLTTLVAYLVLLARLTSYLGKRAAVWVTLALMTAPVGLLISYFAIGSTVESILKFGALQGKN